MPRFRKVFTKTWSNATFRDLSSPTPNGQTLWFYLTTGPLTTQIPGLFSTGEAGFAEKIGWPLEGFRQAFLELVSKGLVKADWKAHLVWVPLSLMENRPENPNIVKGWADTWDELPDCALKLEAFYEFESFLKGLGEDFIQAFYQACMKPFTNLFPYGSLNRVPNGLANSSRNSSLKGLKNPLRNCFLNQEQEKEQEQHSSPSEAEVKNSCLSGVRLEKTFEAKTNTSRSRTHPRLEIFTQEYFLAKNKKYFIEDYPKEGGAAKRTLSKISGDEAYRQAVRAYLACTDQQLIEKGHTFMEFVRDFDRWAKTSKGEINAQGQSSKYANIYE